MFVFKVLSNRAANLANTARLGKNTTYNVFELNLLGTPFLREPDVFFFVPDELYYLTYLFYIINLGITQGPLIHVCSGSCPRCKENV